jgi:hypothetical protein
LPAPIAATISVAVSSLSLVDAFFSARFMAIPLQGVARRDGRSSGMRSVEQKRDGRASRNQRN